VREARRSLPSIAELKPHGRDGRVTSRYFMKQLEPFNPDEFKKLIDNVVGSENVHIPSPSDAVKGVEPAWIVEPANAVEISRVLALGNQQGAKIIARGGGTKLDWGNAPRAANLILSTRRLDRVVDHAAADMTATVQAGCTVESFQQTLARQGQRLALDPLWPDRATIGGILATNDSGSLRLAFGSLRDLLIGITIALPDGTLARSGGKVVKNVAGYDLPKLLIGSFGTLGVIVEATFRLHPLPHQTRDLSFETKVEHLRGILEALSQCSGLIVAAQIQMAEQATPQLTIRVEALPGAIQAKCDRVARALEQAGGKPIAAPSDAWSARQRLFDDSPGVVCKISVLPMDWPRIYAQLIALSSSHAIRWKLLAQLIGIGLLRLNADDENHIVAAMIQMRQQLAALGGSLTVLRCPIDMESKLDVWPDAGDAIDVMRKLKAKFDPKETLAPGRYVGGI